MLTLFVMTLSRKINDVWVSDGLECAGRCFKYRRLLVLFVSHYKGDIYSIFTCVRGKKTLTFTVPLSHPEVFTTWYLPTPFFTELVT